MLAVGVAHVAHARGVGADAGAQVSTARSGPAVALARAVVLVDALSALRPDEAGGALLEDCGDAVLHGVLVRGHAPGQVEGVARDAATGAVAFLEGPREAEAQAGRRSGVAVGAGAAGRASGLALERPVGVRVALQAV